MNAAQRPRGSILLIAEEQLVPAAQLGALDLPAEHGEFVAQDEHLGFGIRGDPAQPENAPDDRVEERVEHGGEWYDGAGRRANRVSVPHRRRTWRRGPGPGTGRSQPHRPSQGSSPAESPTPSPGSHPGDPNPSRPKLDDEQDVEGL